MKLKILALFSAAILLAPFGRGQDLQADLKAIREQAQTEITESAGTVYTVVFDNSGSMEGERIASAKRAFQWWLASVPTGSTWSVYNFDGGGRCVLPFKLNGQKQAAAIISSLEAKTNTPICSTLRKVSKDIARRRVEKPFERHVLLLFTDGAENQDKRGNAGVQQEIAAIRRQSIEVVAIGYAGAGDYLDGYASRYFQANDQQALQAGLAQVQSEIDVNAVIDITPAEMIKLATLKAEPSTDPKARVAAPAPQPAPPPPSEKKSNLVLNIAIAAVIFFFISRIRKAFRH